MLSSNRWGENIGSSTLWQQHRRRIEQWNNALAQYHQHLPTIREDDGQAQLMHLPYECLRMIMLCLSDHHDISSAADAHPSFREIVSEDALWRDLCAFHFSKSQVQQIVAGAGADPNLPTSSKWETIYSKLVRRFGLKETFDETIIFCTHCKCLFWNATQHPCLLPGARCVPISPRSFLDFFTL